MVGGGRRSPPPAKEGGGGGTRRSGKHHSKGSSGGEAFGTGADGQGSAKAAIGRLEGSNLEGATGKGAASSLEDRREPVFALKAIRSETGGGISREETIEAPEVELRSKNRGRSTRSRRRDKSKTRLSVEESPSGIAVMRESENHNELNDGSSVYDSTASSEEENNRNDCDAELIIPEDVQNEIGPLQSPMEIEAPGYLQYARSPLKNPHSNRRVAPKQILNGISVNSDGEEELHSGCNITQKSKQHGGMDLAPKSPTNKNCLDEMTLEPASTAPDTDIPMNDRLEKPICFQSQLEIASSLPLLQGQAVQTQIPLKLQFRKYAHKVFATMRQPASSLIVSTF